MHPLERPRLILPKTGSYLYIEPPIQLIWYVFIGAVLVEPWSNWDGRNLPPWRGFSVLPSNSKSRVYPEQLSAGVRSEGLSI